MTASHTTNYFNVKKKKLQETSAICSYYRRDLTSAICSYCRNDLTNCFDMSTICVNLSPEVVDVRSVWLAQEPI